MLPYPIEAIDETILSNLIENQVGERRDLEFKRDLPGASDSETKEFLVDVTALANAQGGDLIFGISEENGIASDLSGLELQDVDAELLRLESRLRDCVSPRLLGVRLHWIPFQNSRSAIVIRVPASINSPHQAIFKNSRRFWSRNSRGKYEMDVHELRHAFTQSDQLPLNSSNYTLKQSRPHGAPTCPSV